ncbi:MAG: amidohydrolase family protein [Planctomycetes bacterium]|nr:amidohydrolase family protein [Planctomycetota bacterium]
MQKAPNRLEKPLALDSGVKPGKHPSQGILSILRLLLGLVLGLGLLPVFSPGSFALGNEEPPCLALKAGHLLDGAGGCIENGFVVIQGHRIRAVGENPELPENVLISDLGEVYLCPGLIDSFTQLGTAGSLAETTTAVQAVAEALEVFHPGHDDFSCALAEGITTVMLAPTADDVISGRAALVKTWGKDRVARTVLARGPLIMSVAPSCFREGRVPTSRMGALDLLGRSIEEAKPGTVLHAFARGQVHGFFVAEQSYDLQAALHLAAGLEASLTLVGASEADRILNRMEGGDLSFILGPYDFNTAERTLRIPKAVAEAGLPFAFMGGSPRRNPLSLRLTAALAVEAGLDKSHALAALTSTAARLAGVESRLGTLAPGMDADLAVFSHHPLDLSARVLRVYVDGQAAYDSKTACEKITAETQRESLQ